VLVAEPGAGKTTRYPRALHEHKLAGDGEIWVSQPRRIAARLAARRVADELGEPLGRTVGVQVRFEDRTSRATRIRFVTEGILVRRLIADPTLPGVGAVVLDELHERHLDGDLAMGLLREARRGPRRDLLVAAMSATLDAGPVAEYLDVPERSVPGRPHPVAIEHVDGPDDRPLGRRVAAAVRRVLFDKQAAGDVLVFLPGAAEIRHAARALEETAAQAGIDVVPLHGDLPPDAQDRAVRPEGPRRVVLATNVAETSITLPRVQTVIDSGLARVARHSPWSGLSTLTTVPVSRASATQRAGRAGRTGPGRCLRLYTAHDHDTRPFRDPPEIQRDDLSYLVLALAARDRPSRSFPFLDPPPPAAVDAAENLLRRLGALDSAGGITERGRQLLTIPTHPRLARLVDEAASRGIAERGALAAAVLGERELRLDLRPGPRHPGGPPVAPRSGPSDVLARVEAFEAAERDGLRSGAMRAHRLDGGVVRVVDRSRRQLLAAARRLPPPSADTPVPASLEEEDAALGLAVLAAFPDRVARRRRPGGGKVVLAGGGGAARMAPESEVDEAELLVAVDAEVGRGGEAVVRVASAIEPEWLLELFPDRLTDDLNVRYDPERDRIEVARVLAYDGLELERSPVPPGTEPPELDPDAVSRALVEAARERGTARLVDADALERLRRRVAFAAVHAPPPPTSRAAADTPAPPRAIDDALLDRAVAAAADGRRRLQDLSGTVVLDHLLGLLDPALVAVLDRLAPTHIEIPGRARVPVDYPPATEVRRKPPAVASRLQDFFGATEGPTVAGGRVPLTLHLQAPNGRAVQVTDDLGGFWARHYPGVRKELMRRYPRHAWPENPASAAPSRPGRRPRRR